MIPLLLIGERRQRRELDVEVDLVEFVEGQHLQDGEERVELEIEALREVEQYAAILDVRVVNDLSSQGHYVSPKNNEEMKITRLTRSAGIFDCA